MLLNFYALRSLFCFASARKDRCLTIQSKIGILDLGLEIFISNYSDGQNTGLVSYGGGNGGRYIQRRSIDD